MTNSQCQIYRMEEISSSMVPPGSIVVFGGTFDPIHQGHIEVINTLCNFFPKVVIAPTTANPWKKRAPTPLSLRLEMIDIVLSNLLIQTNLSVYRNGYQFAEEVVIELRKSSSSDSQIWWAIGEDSASTVHRWRNWHSLGVPVVSLPIVTDIHSTAIRSNSTCILPVLKDFINLNGLYE